MRSKPRSWKSFPLAARSRGRVGLPLVFALLAGAAPAAANPTALVQDLVAQGVEPHEAQALSSATCHALAATGRYRVTCGDDLRALLGYEAVVMALDACRDGGCRGDPAAASEASYVLSGQVMRVAERWILSLSLVDVKRSRPLARSEVRAESIAKLYDQVGEAVSALFAERAPKPAR